MSKGRSVPAEDAAIYLAAIVGSSDDAIVSKDLTGIITSWNAAAERLFGYTAEEIVGKSVLTIIPQELHSQEAEILAKLGAGQRIDHFETERVRKNGERVWVSLTISPIKNAQGKIIGASKIARDISDRKRVQEALIQSEKLAAIGRMAAAIAHEINNPLEAVTNLAYLLTCDPSLSPTAQFYAKTLIEEVGRASEITKQTLSFYRDSGKPGLFQVSDLLDNVISVNRSKLSQRNIEVVRDYRTEEPAYGFASEVRQVFSNLFLNAIDAVGERGRIVIRTRLLRTIKEPRLIVLVADNGSGILDEHKDKLFEPFFTTKSAHGNGLGLWVSVGIMEKHGGTISARSRTAAGHSGTVFRVSLPLKEASEPRHKVA